MKCSSAQIFIPNYTVFESNRIDKKKKQWLRDENVKTITHTHTCAERHTDKNL